MIKVSKIDWVGEHRLRFPLNDESIGEYDFAKIVEETGPMLEPLRNLDYFKRVFVEFGAPTWPNGFDVAPGWLHQEIATAGNLNRPAHA